MSSAASKPQTPDPVDTAPETQRAAEAAIAAANAEEAQDERNLDQRAMRIARETLTRDVRDLMLNDMKDRKTFLPWNLRNEAEQEELIQQVSSLAASIVERVVTIVAAGGRRTIRAHLAQATIKDGIKAVIELSQSDEQRHQLLDSVGSSVLIVIADPEIYEGDRGPVSITKQQPDLPLAEGTGSEGETL